MIYIGANRNDISSIADDWSDRLRSFLFGKRDNKVWVMDGRKKISGHDVYFEKMERTVKYHEKAGMLSVIESKWVIGELNYFKKNYNKVVKAEEVELKLEAQAYTTRASKTTKKAHDEYKELMKKLYTAYTDYDSGNGKSVSYYYFEKLNIRTCPYCNRQFTFTLHTSNVKTSPEYDHFYDKANYPVLSVSFYNLVPSCHTCNHVKGEKKTAKVNPYFRGFKSKFYIYDKENGSMRLSAVEMLHKGEGDLQLRMEDGREDAEDMSNVRTFGLKGLYDMHSDYVKDLLEKAVAYDRTAREQLADAFQKRGYTADQVFEFIWGKYLDVAYYNNRPLSKLTRDLLDQLDIVK